MTTMNTQNDQYNRHAMIKNIREGVQAIRKVYYGDYPREHQRGWHVTMSNKHDLHPAIFQAIDIAPPTDWHQLVLEYPYISETDPSRLAYTRDDRSGINDRQTVTTIGKYLARHFPDVSDHVIREIAALYSGATCKIMNTMPEMLDVVRNGAKSCMTLSNRDDDAHPYQAYDPALGWSIAVRMDGTTYRARALVYTDPNAETDTAYFVRSYNKPDDPSSYSQPDDLLEAWLKGQGIAKRDSWEGAVLRYIPYGDKFLAPFLDGHDKQVEITSSSTTLMTICSEGEYTFDNTDGTPTSTEGDCECANCGDNFDDGDGHWAGSSGEDHICDYCARDNYTYAYTRHGNQYYIYSGDVVYVASQGEYYHDRYLGENNIVRCVDTDEYEHTDDAVYLERESEWYSSDSDAIVYCEFSCEYELIDNCVELHDGEWAHINDTWECGHSNNYYLCDAVSPYETPCGTLVHPDYAADYAEATVTTNTIEA